MIGVLRNSQNFEPAVKNKSTFAQTGEFNQHIRPASGTVKHSKASSMAYLLADFKKFVKLLPVTDKTRIFDVATFAWIFCLQKHSMAGVSFGPGSGANMSFL